MTYEQIYLNALCELQSGEISYEEYEKKIAPLKREATDTVPFTDAERDIFLEAMMREKVYRTEWVLGAEQYEYVCDTIIDKVRGKGLL